MADPHPSREQLRDFLGGNLAEDRAQGVEEHLWSCPECAEILAQLGDGADPFLSRIRSLGEPVAKKTDQPKPPPVPISALQPSVSLLDSVSNRRTVRERAREPAESTPTPAPPADAVWLTLLLVALVVFVLGGTATWQIIAARRAHMQAEEAQAQARVALEKARQVVEEKKTAFDPESLRQQLLRKYGALHQAPLAEFRSLAQTYADRGQFTQAETLLQESVAKLDQPDSDVAKRQALLLDLGSLYQRLKLSAKAQATWSKLIDSANPPESSDVRRARVLLAQSYRTDRKLSEAELVLTHGLERSADVNFDRPETLALAQMLAGLYGSQENYGSAEPLYARIWESQVRVPGADHPETLRSLERWVTALAAQKKWERAENLGTRLLESQRRLRGHDHEETLKSQRVLAEMYDQQHKYVEAEPHWKALLDARRREWGEDHSEVAELLRVYGVALVGQDKFEEAQPSLRAAVKAWRKLRPAGWQCLQTKALLADCLVRDKKFEEAESLLLASYEGLVKIERALPREAQSLRGETQARIVRLYEAWKRPEDAARWKKK